MIYGIDGDDRPIEDLELPVNGEIGAKAGLLDPDGFLFIRTYRLVIRLFRVQVPFIGLQER